QLQETRRVPAVDQQSYSRRCPTRRDRLSGRFEQHHRSADTDRRAAARRRSPSARRGASCASDGARGGPVSLRDVLRIVPLLAAALVASAAPCSALQIQRFTLSNGAVMLVSE